jgi:hypothetical protein
MYVISNFGVFFYVFSSHGPATGYDVTSNVNKLLHFTGVEKSKTNPRFFF